MKTIFFILLAICTITLIQSTNLKSKIKNENKGFFDAITPDINLPSTDDLKNIIPESLTNPNRKFYVKGLEILSDLSDESFNTLDKLQMELKTAEKKCEDAKAANLQYEDLLSIKIGRCDKLIDADILKETNAKEAINVAIKELNTKIQNANNDHDACLSNNNTDVNTDVDTDSKETTTTNDNDNNNVNCELNPEVNSWNSTVDSKTKELEGIEKRIQAFEQEKEETKGLLQGYNELKNNADKMKSAETSICENADYISRIIKSKTADEKYYVDTKALFEKHL